MKPLIPLKIELLIVSTVFVCHAATSLPRSTPEAQGVSSSALAELVQALDRQIQGMHSVMIVRHGRVIAEGWWAPYAAEHRHVLYSLSKSFTSTAVGFAVAEGRLRIDDEVMGTPVDRSRPTPSHPMNCRLLLASMALFLAGPGLSAEEPVVRLYPGKAPGSESWTHTEKESTRNLWNIRVVYNVTDPTLTVFKPVPAKANGTAVVICPGGAFFALSIDSEGNDVARWLTEKGFTCFVLKYRLVECKTDDPTAEVLSRGALDPIVAPIVKLALADGLAAIGHIRKQANVYGVRPDRIGIIGFSAGGTVAASVGFNYTPETRPDFVAPVYPAYMWTIKDKGVPGDAPPLFVLAATDDPLGLAPQSVQIYQDWVAARKPAEIHLYSKGGHGFGMRIQNLPSDRWIQLFADWLGTQELASK